MTRLTPPQATPQAIEHRLAQKDDFIRIATDVWEADLTLSEINETWEETTAHVR
jgi:hypothetical protein